MDNVSGARKNAAGITMLPVQENGPDWLWRQL